MIFPVRFHLFGLTVEAHQVLEIAAYGFGFQLYLLLKRRWPRGPAMTVEQTAKVMLGALLELTHTLPKESAFALLKAKVKNAKLLEVDCRAIDAGIACLRSQRDAHPAAPAPDHELTHTH